MKYGRLFINYAHEDASFVRQLVVDLSDSGIPVWFDEWELPSNLHGNPLHDALLSAVTSCNAGLTLRSPAWREKIDRLTNYEGRTPAWSALWAGSPRDEALRLEGPLSYEAHVRKYKFGSFMKWFDAVLDEDELGFGPLEARRTIVYQPKVFADGKLNTGEYATIPLEQYSFDQGPILGESLWISFGDYRRGIERLVEELNLLPGQTPHGWFECRQDEAKGGA